MADHDNSAKTEEPTARRLQKGRERGQVAVSMEIKTWAMFLGAAIALAALIPAMAADVAHAIVPFLESPDRMRVDVDTVRLGLLDVTLAVAGIVGPTAALLMVFGIVAGVGQVGFLWAPSRIEFDGSRLSLLKGAERLFGPKALVEFLKGVLKLTVVAAVTSGLAVPLLADVGPQVGLGVGEALQRLHTVTFRVTVGAVAVMTVIAAADLLFQRFSFLREMRMTREEVRDEHRQSEGDPHVKARIRKLRQERAKRRMMAAVPEADVVVTNPTHYAVALAYKMGEMLAPKVVAKGVDHLARRIREVAAEHDVPIVENPPMAQALYATVEIDEEIPPEHYEAVAQVIGYVMRLKGRLG
jgi:flagellar biosynthetic protein FlhB